MRSRLSAWLLATAALTGCDASGSTQGGTPVVADPCADADAGDTWSYLYTCYFGPGGKASCTGQGFCHGGPEMTGALTSGYVCGTSRESCWRGMTLGISSCEAGVTASDGGADEAGVPACMQTMAPIVPSGGASDPTTTALWPALRGASGPGLHNMPYSASTGGVTFTPQDLDRISAWIRAGAQYN
jgi:hypothetical protein